MQDLAIVLERFNRKERNWLIRDAVGAAPTKLDSGFLAKLEAALKLRKPNFKFAQNIWWATDYHIDWLVAALFILKEREEHALKPQPNTHNLVQGTQQDVDLVIASDNDIILVEAKGVGSWTGEGWSNKVIRLKSMAPTIVSPDGVSGTVQLHFVLCSPNPGQKVDVEGWSPWMLNQGSPLRIQLKVTPPGGKFLKVERCDDKGKTNAKGGHWRVLLDKTSDGFVN